MKKRSILIIALALVMCLSLIAATACKDIVDPSVQSLSIANSADLMAKWNVGEADRTVEVTLTDGLKDKTVTITTEPEGVISVDGMTLHAEKAGTATVKATVVLDDEHSFSDEVEITVSYNYQLQITNKSDLTKAFRLGEADRTVSVQLPEAIKDNPVTITSSKTDVVSVVNGKIHAVAKGESTITASTTLNGSTFKDSFKVTVWGDFDLVVNNKAALEQPIGKYAESVAIDYALIEAGDYTAKDVTITSSNPEVAAIADGKLDPIEVGETVVTVACGGKTVTINVTIEVLAELKIAAFDETVMYYTGDVGCVLPTVTMAKNSADEEVEVEIRVITDGLTLSADKTRVTANEVGKYKVMYRFDDIEGKPAKEVVITVTMVDELYGATGAYNKSVNFADAHLKMSLNEVAEGEYKQVTTFGTDSLLFAKMNGAASKLYYAEATFAVPNTASDVDVAVGLGHFSSVQQQYAYISKISTFSGDYHNIEIDYSKTDNVALGSTAANGQTAMFMYKALLTRHIEKLAGDAFEDQSTTLVKVAVAREGDYFYTFINGQYVNCLTPATLRNVDTIPAIVGKYIFKGGTEISDVLYLGGESEVHAKLDEMLGVNREKMIVHYSGRDDKVDGTYQRTFQNTITTDGITDRGLGFNFENTSSYHHQNGSVISPNIWFDGSFTFSYDYKPSKISYTNSISGGNRYAVILEARDHQYISGQNTGYGNESMEVVGKYANDSGTMYSDNKVRLFFDGNHGDHNDSIAASKYVDVTAAYGIRYTLTRVINGNAVIAIMTATVLDESGNPTNVSYTKIETITRKNMDQPIILLWHSMGLDGEFSNVQWSMLPDGIDIAAIAEATEAVPVTLTDEETTYEVDGDDKATTLYKFTVMPNGIINKVVFDLGQQLPVGEYEVTVLAKANVAASTSQTLKLCAKKITIGEGDQYLSLDNFVVGHGTYEVQLVRIPEPDPVKIMNKDALQEYWKTGDDDRTMEIKLGKDVDETTLNIESSDDTIVSVTGKVLTALKAGKVTITVTVGTGEDTFSDTVELTVHYNYTLTITNKDALTAVYRIEDEDRTVETSFTEGVEDVTVVITSSDDEVISIVEGKLHALKKGTATITVTVTIDEDNVFTDKVTVEVLGELIVNVTNKDELEAPIGVSDEAREITIALVEAGDYTLANVVPTSDDETVATVAISEDGKIMITPVAAGTTTIKLTCGGKTATINVTVVNAILEIETDAVTHYTNEEFAIPAIVKATDDQDNDKTELVVITASNGLTLSEDKTKATAEAIGVYTLTYSLQIGDAAPVTREVTVTILENLFVATGAHVGDNQADGSELADAEVESVLVEKDGVYTQQTTFGTDNLAYAQLNGSKASQYYYAEATFDIETLTVSSGEVIVALGHFLTGANDRQVLMSTLNVQMCNVVTIPAELNKHGNAFLTTHAELASNAAQNHYKNNSGVYQQDYTVAFSVFKSKFWDTNTSTKHVTIAIAREGEYFYTFVDGHYVCCVTNKEFRNDDTLPAILGMNFKSGGVVISEVSYIYETTAVKAKLDEVLGVNKEKMIVGYNANNIGTTDTYKKSFTAGKIDTNVEERGLGFDYKNTDNGNQNGSAFSPYVWFDGNFTFSWDYTFTSKGTSSPGGGNQYKSLFEIRNTYAYANESIQVGLEYTDPTSPKLFLDETGSNLSATNLAGSNGIALEEGCHVRFTVTRIREGATNKIIMTATIINEDGTLGTTYTRIATSTKTDTNMVLPLWHNSGVSGKYSNLSWAVLPDDIDVSFVEETDGIVATRLTETITPDEGEPETVNLDKWQVTLNSQTQNVVIDLGENALEAGDYTITISANGQEILGTGALTSLDIYTITDPITVAADAQYLKLSNIALGHGSYTITFTKVVVEPEPTPEEPVETPETPEA